MLPLGVVGLTVVSKPLLVSVSSARKPAAANEAWVKRGLMPTVPTLTGRLKGTAMLVRPEDAVTGVDLAGRPGQARHGDRRWAASPLWPPGCRRRPGRRS